MSRRFVRSIKNLSSSPTEIKIKQATSNDKFGPTATELNNISILTNDPIALKQICGILRKRLNDTSKNWRHILKSLTVCMYCMVAGSPEFVSWIKCNAFIIKTLQEFQIRGFDDLSQQIRSKAIKITTLLDNKSLLEEKRTKFHIFRTQMSHPATYLRSSLDINRSSVDIKLEGILPSSTPMRGAYSLDLVRPTQTWDIPTAKNEILSNSILSDITEEQYEDPLQSVRGFR